MRKTPIALIVLSLLATIAVVSGCKRETPRMTYMPEMAYSPAVKAQEPGSMRMPVEGTIPRGFTPYRYKGQPEAAGRNLRNPIKRTKMNLEKGRELYGIYCAVCHGKFGEGDGTVVPKFPRPPSLQSAKVRGWSDGRIFHVMTDGQALMPSYASQVSQEDRWKIVNYVRVIQRAKNPTASDLRKAQDW